MCTDTCPDPRDAAIYATRALRGLQIMLADRPAVCAGDAELPLLLEIINDRLEPAVQQLQDYVPRNWTPPA